MAAVGLAAFSCTFPDYRFDAEPPEPCNNDISDGSETGIDCGGDCDPCPCQEDEDCLGADQVCDEGVCRGPCGNDECPPTPTCTDDEKNGDETDTDCGGSCERKCAIGDDCKLPKDCVEGVCDETCQPPTCDDGVHNGFEPWIDCGGDCPDKCENGEPCDVNEDCLLDTCVENATGQFQCAPPFCDNHMLDPGETDIDCGGGDCPKCGEDDICVEDSDCVEGVCGDDEKCAAPECNDEVLNGDETDMDCGGGEPMGCPPCDAGDRCEVASDCEDEVCAIPSDCEDDACDKVCQEPACNDEISNGDESDVDCGGSCAKGCPLGDLCGADRDCDSGICDMPPDAPAVCVSCDDTLLNGSELGTDCGGSDCPLCQPGDECIADAGCVNYRCDGECVTGLELDYHCGQCGQMPNDQIKAFLRLRNLSEEPIDVSDVVVRYYLSTDAPQSVIDGFSFECEYMAEHRCGSQGLYPYTAANDSDTTHYFETLIESTEPIPGEGSAELEITIRLNGTTLDQQDDYSFEFGSDYHLNWQVITLHRQGTRIWGNEP